MLAKGALFGAELTADIGSFIDIHVCNVEFAYTQSSQRQQVNPAHSSDSGNGDSCFTELYLISNANQADVARKFMIYQVFNGWCWHER